MPSVICFCCVLSFFSTMPKDWMERMCLNDLFCVEWDEKLNTVSQPCKAKNCHNTAVLDENLGSCTHPFTNHGQIWHVGVDPQCTVPHHISSWSVYSVVYNHANLTNLGIIGGSCTHTVRQSGQIWLPWVRWPTVYAHVPKFIWIGYCVALGGKVPKFGCVFNLSTFCGGAT